MSESHPDTTAMTQTEIMIRNLEAAGFSEDEIQYELDGYGCMPDFARFDSSERADDRLARDAGPGQDTAYRRLPR